MAGVGQALPGGPLPLGDLLGIGEAGADLSLTVGRLHLRLAHGRYELQRHNPKFAMREQRLARVIHSSRNRGSRRLAV